MPAFLFILLVACGLFAAGAIALFGFLWRRRSAARLMAMRAATSIAAILLCFVVLEFLFYDVIILNAGFGFTLADERWKVKYGGPINEDGYRDFDHSAATLEAKKVAIVVGDSFAVGSGIKDVEDRFSNLLATRLAGEWEFVNIARGGWDTRDEYSAIAGYSPVPELIVLSYYINDITGVTPSLHESSFWITQPAEWLRPLVDHSYFANFAYWKIYRISGMRKMGRGYIDFIVDAFDDPAVWTRHVAQIQQIIDFAQSRRVRLVAVVFPEMMEVERTASITARVADLFRQHDVPVIDLATVFRGGDPSELTVNSMDSHPNEAANAIVAEHLYRLVSGLDLDHSSAAPNGP